MALEFIPFDKFDAKAHIRKQMLAQKAWAAKEKQDKIYKKLKMDPPPKGPHSSRPDFTKNNVENILPTPWNGALHRRPGADRNI